MLMHQKASRYWAKKIQNGEQLILECLEISAVNYILYALNVERFANFHIYECSAQLFFGSNNNT